MAFLVECGEQIAIAGASIGVSASIVLLLEVCVLTVQCANDLGALLKYAPTMQLFRDMKAHLC